MQGVDGAGWLPVSVSFRPFRGQSSSTMAWATQSPSKQTNTLEQKDTKIAKKSKTGNDFRRFQYVFQRRPQPSLEALPAFFLRDLCDLLFSCFRVFPSVQGIFMLDRNQKTYVLRAGRLSVSVSFRPFRGQSCSTSVWDSRLPSAKTNSLEQKLTKETKNTRVVTLLQIQYVTTDNDNRRSKPARFFPRLRCLCYLLFKVFLCLTRIGCWSRLGAGPHKANEGLGKGGPARNQRSVPRTAEGPSKTKSRVEM